MTSQALHELERQIQAAGRIAVILHVSPDGDTCGSALALRRALMFKGKQVEVLCDDPIPRIYQDLDGADAVRAPESVDGAPFDAAIAVDVADRDRMGRCLAVFDRALHTAQIDHHSTNPGYAGVNFIRTPLSATAVLVKEAVDALGAPLDKKTAHCLFVGVSTDTGNFKQENTDPEALALAARCVEAGVDIAAVTRRVFDVRPLCQVKLIARALSGMEVFHHGQLAMLELSWRDFEETQSLPEHTEGIVNFGINTEGVRVACLLSEKNGGINCSLRALPPHNMAKVAKALGGGGHALAAGCTLDTSIAKAYQMMRDILIKELDQAE